MKAILIGLGLCFASSGAWSHDWNKIPTKSWPGNDKYEDCMAISRIVGAAILTSEAGKLAYRESLRIYGPERLLELMLEQMSKECKH